MAEEVPQVLTFFIGQEEFCLDARIIKSVVRPGPVTRVPGAREFVAGLVYYKGEILPVIDLAALVGAVRERPKDYTRLIITEYNGEAIGLAVSRIGETVKVPPSGAVFLGLAQALAQAQKEGR